MKRKKKLILAHKEYSYVYKEILSLDYLYIDNRIIGIIDYINTSSLYKEKHPIVAYFQSIIFT